ncbi:hypothetical protein ABPG74_007957 [Tetrahymena malaccensis]
MDQSDNNQDSSFDLKTNQLIINLNQMKYNYLYYDIIVTSYLYPVLLLNLRRQANQSLFAIGQETKVNNYFQMFRIIKKDRIDGFYKGITPLYSQKLLQTYVQTFFQNSSEFKFNELIKLSTLYITYPMILISDMLVLNSYKPISSSNGGFEMFQILYDQYGGLKGIYKGFSLFFVANLIKALPLAFVNQNNNDKYYLYFISSILSYPFETLRARLIAIPDLNLNAKTMYSFAQNMYKYESIKGYFVGYLPFLTFNLMLQAYNKYYLSQTLKTNLKSQKQIPKKITD